VEVLLQIYIGLEKEIAFLFALMDKAENPIEFGTLNETAKYLRQAVAPVKMACVRMSWSCEPGETMDKYNDVVALGNWQDYV
jgi:hypothetical protein